MQYVIRSLDSQSFLLVCFGVFSSYMCILASTNSTYQFPIQRAKPGFGEAERSGAQDVCTIHCFWPFRHRCWFQAGASAVCCLCRSISAARGLLDLNLWSSWSHCLPLSRGGSNGAICCQHGLHSCHVDPKPFLFISTFFVCWCSSLDPVISIFFWVKSPFSLAASLCPCQLVPQTSWYQALPRSQARILGGVGSTWGVPYMGYPNSWMVSFMEHPSTKWMLSNDFFGGPPWLWNLHIVRDVKRIWAAQMGVCDRQEPGQNHQNRNFTTGFRRFWLNGGRRSFPRLSFQSRFHS